MWEVGRVYFSCFPVIIHDKNDRSGIVTIYMIIEIGYIYKYMIITICNKK